MPMAHAHRRYMHWIDRRQFSAIFFALQRLAVCALLPPHDRMHVFVREEKQ